MVSRVFCFTAAAAAVLGVTLGAQPAATRTAEARRRTVSISTDHLSVAATLAPLQMTRAGRVTLTTEITPKAGMHVYAPGSQYRAVRITLPANSLFTVDGPPTYPKPVLYTFKPLNETVPVYDGPVRLIARMALDASRPLGAPLRRPLPVTLRASLDYQACDDRQCYLPESVPLRWTVIAIP